MDLLLLIVAVLATLALFATTRAGQNRLKNTPLRDRIPGAATREDLAFLLDACGGDQCERENRLAAERAQVPDLTEAEHCRRAIRKVIAARNR